MARIPIALQLYSVREDCARDLPGTLKAVADMGYDGVEFAGYHGRSAKELKQLLTKLKLKVAGTHIGIDTLLPDKLQSTVDFHRELGCKYLIVPWLQKATKQDWMDTAKTLSEIANKLKPHRMRTGYHNHAHDFQPLDGSTAWDILFSNSSKDVLMQLDLGNAMHGGADPVPYIAKYPGQSVTIHLKEFSKTNPKAVLGQGDVPWQRVFELCETVGGTKWYIVEYEVPGLPPLECVAQCVQNLRAMGK
jgi:sugar phosphate isomerase/epimerase